MFLNNNKIKYKSLLYLLPIGIRLKFKYPMGSTFELDRINININGHRCIWITDTFMYIFSF